MRLLLACTVCLWLATLAAAAPEQLIEQDFSAPGEPARQLNGSVNEQVEGVLPTGWRDDSTWSQAWMQYQLLSEADQMFLRASLQQLESGRGQLVHMLPPMSETALYRLRYTARKSPPSRWPDTLAVQVGVRMRGEPYLWLWSTRPRITSQWQTQDQYFVVEATDKPTGLYITLDEPGTLDIADVRLERVEPEDVAAALIAEYPDGGPANLLRHSRLPAGLPSGWTLDRNYSDGDRVQIDADTRTNGPSGYPPLRIDAFSGFKLYSEPFAVPLAFKPHHASLWVCGEGRIDLAVEIDGKTVASGSLELAPDQDWREMRLPFDPVLFARAHTLVIGGVGQFWIDALRVAPVDGDPQYQSQMPCEVTLALPESDASTARVQFADEPATFNWCVTGDAERAIVKMRVVNAYHASKLLPDHQAKVQPGLLVVGEGRFDRFEQTPLGTFRIEAWVEDDQGQVISPVDELVVHRVPRPRYWNRDAPSSHFGVHTNSTTRHNVMAKAIGINWVRLHDAGSQYVGWSYLEPQPGQWQFFDIPIHRYRDHHLMILGELGTAPAWASHRRAVNAPANEYFDRWFAPADYDAWANYVSVVTSRYLGEIEVWDVWNEPYWPDFFIFGYDPHAPNSRNGYVSSPDAVREYRRLMRLARRSARQVSPTLQTVGINTRHGADQPEVGPRWTQRLVDRGGLQFCDIVGYHHYLNEAVGFAGDDVQRGFDTTFAPIAERSGWSRQPIWMTEGNAVRQTIGCGMYRHVLPTDEADEDWITTADQHCRYVVRLLSMGVDKVFLYSMHAHRHLGDPGQWATLVTPDGYLHPSGAAHAVMAWLLEDSRFVEQVPLGAGVQAFVFQTPRGAVAAVMPQADHAPLHLPRAPEFELQSQAYDLFGNPIERDAPVDQTMLYLAAPGEEAKDLAEVLRKGR